MSAAVRPADEGDLEAVADVFRAAVADLFGRHGFDPPDPPRDVLVGGAAHVLRHDAPRFAVGEAGGRVVAYGASVERGRLLFLSALFVLPEHQGAGLGRALLAAVLGGASDAVRVRTTLADSFQPVSQAMYMRQGMLPAAVAYTVAGVPAAPPAGDVAEQAADADALWSVDLAAYGADRAADHAYWARSAGRTVWGRDGRPVAWSYRSRRGRIGPVAGIDAGACAAALAAELARAAAEGAAVDLVALSSARPALAVALAAGLRVTGPAGVLLSTEPGPDALVPSGYMLL